MVVILYQAPGDPWLWVGWSIIQKWLGTAKFITNAKWYWSSDIATKDNTAYGAARLGESAQYEEIDISIGGVRTTSNKAYSVVQHSSPIEDAYESVTEANTDGTAENLDYEN